MGKSHKTLQFGSHESGIIQTIYDSSQPTPIGLHDAMKISGRSFPATFPQTRCRLRQSVFPFVVLFFLLHVVLFQPHLLRGQAVAPATGTSTPTTARIIHGTVKSGNMPIPGAGVSATNTATKEQVNTSTDVDGSYALRIPSEGHYSVRVQMAAFSASAREVELDASHQDVQTNFELILLSRAREASGEPEHRASAGGRGCRSSAARRTALRRRRDTRRCTSPPGPTCSDSSTHSGSRSCRCRAACPRSRDTSRSR